MHYSKVVLAYLAASAVAVSVPRHDGSSNNKLEARDNVKRPVTLNSRNVLGSTMKRHNTGEKGAGNAGTNKKRDNDNDNDNDNNNKNRGRNGRNGRKNNDNDKRDEDDNKNRGRNGRNGGKNNDNDNDNDNKNNNDNDKRDEDDNKNGGRNGRNGGKINDNDNDNDIKNNNDNDKRDAQDKSNSKADAGQGQNGIFGKCNPAMDFQLGRGNRKDTEGTFLPTDPLVASGQQDALNPNIITNRICDQLGNVCNATQEGKDKCLAAKAEISALGSKDASVADKWNAALGVKP